MRSSDQLRHIDNSAQPAKEQTVDVSAVVAQEDEIAADDQDSRAGSCPEKELTPDRKCHLR